MPPPIGGAGPTVTNLYTRDHAANNTSYTSDSVSFVAGRVYLLSISSNAAGTSPVPTLSGTGSWTQIATAAAASGRRITVWRWAPGSPASGTITYDFAGNTQNNASVSIEECRTDNGGTNGADAIVQSATNNNDAGSNTMSVTLAAFASATNGTVAFFANNNGATATTPGTGFTELADFRVSGESSRHYVEWRADNDTSADATTTGNPAWVGVAVELKAETKSGAGAISQGTEVGGRVTPTSGGFDSVLGNGGAAIAVPKPTGVAVGDLIVVAVYKAQNEGNLGTPTGFAVAWDPPVGGRLRVYTRTADGTEGATFTVNITGGGSATVGVVGASFWVRGTSGIHAIAGVANGVGSPVTVDAPTTTAPNTLLVAFAAAEAAAVLTASWSPASEQVDTGSDPGTAASLSVATRSVAAAGDPGDDTATLSGSPSRTDTVSIVFAAPNVAKGTKAAFAPSTVDQGSSLAGAGRKDAAGAASIDQASTITATGRESSAGVAIVTPATDATSSGRKDAAGAALIAVDVAITATGEADAPEEHSGTASISQGSMLAASGTKAVATDAPTISPTVGVTASGTKAAAAAGAIDQATDVAATGRESSAGVGILTSSPTQTAAGAKATSGAAAVSASTSVAAAGHKGARSAAEIEAATAITADAEDPNVREGTAAISQGSAATATGIAERGGSSTIGAVVTITGQGDKSVPRIGSPTRAAVVRRSVSIAAAVGVPTRARPVRSATSVHSVRVPSRIERVGGATSVRVVK